MGRWFFGPFWEASGRSRNQTTQDGKVASAVTGERLGARLGDAGGGQGASNPLARRSGERAHFASRGWSLIIGLQSVVAALRKTPSETRLGIGQQQDQGRGRVGERPDRSGGGRHQAASAIGGR